MIHCINPTRLIFFLLYFISLALMIADLLIDFSEIAVFYILTNAILIYRVIGVYFHTTLVHLLCMVGLLVFFFNIDWKNIDRENTKSIAIPFAIQFLFSLHLLCLYGCKPAQKACIVGIHAFLGLMVVILFFWICAFVAQISVAQCVIEIVYMLIFLILVLTPQFLSCNQAVRRAATDEYICQQLECYVSSEDDDEGEDDDSCSKPCERPPPCRQPVNRCPPKSSSSDCDRPRRRMVKKSPPGRRCCSQDRKTAADACQLSDLERWDQYICNKRDIFTANPCCERMATVSTAVGKNCAQQCFHGKQRTCPNLKDYDSPDSNRMKLANSESNMRKIADETDIERCDSPIQQLRRRKPAKSESCLRDRRTNDESSSDKPKQVSSEKLIGRCNKNFDTKSDCICSRAYRDRSPRHRKDDRKAYSANKKYKSPDCSPDDEAYPVYNKCKSYDSSPDDESCPAYKRNKSCDYSPDDEPYPVHKKYKSCDRSPNDEARSRDRRRCPSPKAAKKDKCTAEDSMYCKKKPDVFTANPCWEPLEIGPEDIPKECCSKSKPKQRMRKGKNCERQSRRRDELECLPERRRRQRDPPDSPDFECESPAYQAMRKRHKPTVRRAKCRCRDDDDSYDSQDSPSQRYDRRGSPHRIRHSPSPPKRRAKRDTAELQMSNRKKTDDRDSQCSCSTTGKDEQPAEQEISRSNKDKEECCCSPTGKDEMTKPVEQKISPSNKDKEEISSRKKTDYEAAQDEKLSQPKQTKNNGDRKGSSNTTGKDKKTNPVEKLISHCFRDKKESSSSVKKEGRSKDVTKDEKPTTSKKATENAKKKEENNKNSSVNNTEVEEEPKNPPQKIKSAEKERQ